MKLLSDITLMRISTSDIGTFGVILNDKKIPICVTIEKPWRNNAAFKSCIPEGTYEFSKYSSAKYPNVWQILKVPNRSHILIHAANTEEELEGCIAPGNKFFAKGVLESQAALDNLRKILADRGTIKIVNRYEEK